MRDRSYTDLIAGSFLKNYDLPALTDYKGNTLKYSDVAARVCGIHKLFSTLHIGVGDRVAICGRNSSNWAVAFIAATTYGAVAVPLLHEFTAENIIHAVNHSGSRILFVSEEIWTKVKGELENSELICISLADLSIIMGEERIPIDKTPVNNMQLFCDSLHRYGPEDMLVLNYTSGTTSNPKGVMLPERAVLSNILFGYEVMPVLKRKDTVVSLLPLAHTYSMSFEFLVEFTLGMQIFFLPGRLHSRLILDAFETARPRVIIMVPMLLEKIVKNGVLPVISKPGIRILRSIPGIRQIVNRKIKDGLYDKLGGNFYQVIVGGAALDREVESLLMDIRFPFTVGYGMTECSPIICYEDWQRFKRHTCGKEAPRMQIRIDLSNSNKTGEVLVKGDNMMLGYYHNPEATALAIDKDGWLHTGDIGEIDTDGNLSILGRSKTMFLSATGQNVYPEEIEGVVSNLDMVKECLAVKRGENIAVLVYLDPEEIAANHITAEDMYDYKKVLLDAANARLPLYSRIASIEYVDEPFQKTPKMSIKRYLYN